MSKKVLCERCNKAIVAIETSRKNGAPHHDWDGRKYHKKCYKIQCLLSDFINEFNLNTI